MSGQHAGEVGVSKYRQDERRRRGTFLAGLLLAVVAAGALFYALTGNLSPGAAIILALGFVGGTAAANWIYLRNADELVRASNVSACIFGFALLVVLYPTWLILHAGDVAPEPSLTVMYIAPVVFGAVGYIWKRFR